ncbi:tail fiber domain-containing protein [Rhizobium favelukesii]|uniref:Peptidase S74 domain-containing protein n=1 Tax=Rhizobium favelukesii TaxID=348824 RepID=W6RAJ0_9HYPH|nr:tail fiber domain-containing protein [Rhizobium favelukesii]MCS0459331.1 tail fiber domain-containing protein [Rhizobium favelukesii]CDM57370.1 putative predicted protein [Rhizobium favelukesii]
MASSPSTQTTINKTELPDWVDKAGQENLQIANDLASRPYEGYNGSVTAGQTDLQQQANTNASQNANAWLPTMNGAVDATKAATTYTPRSFLSGNVGDYMNPYLDQVESRAVDNAGTAFKNNLNTIGDTAISAGAFGGSRQGVAEGVAAAENARQVGDLSAQIRAQGFDTASGLMENDANRDLQGQQIRTQAAGQLGDLATAGNTLSNQNSALLSALGQSQQQTNQQGLQEQYAKWQEQQNYPLQQLNLRLAALGATPYGGTQSQTSTASGGGNTGMSAIGGFLGILPFLGGLSDERDKTDIEELGKDPETGLTIYAYRYKGDPKNTPKVVGPMAQEVEKKWPGSVREIGGHKIIKANLGFGGGA